jgi:tRNA(Ile)-lysidine synthase
MNRINTHVTIFGITPYQQNSDAGFEKTISLLADAEILYNEAIALRRKKLITTVGNEIHIPVLKLAKLPAAKTILYEIISAYGFVPSQLDDAFHLLQAESGKYIASTSHRIIRNRAWLIITPQKTEEAINILIEENNQQIHFQNGILQLKLLSAADVQVINDSNMALLDASAISFPLLLRPWKAGDYFYPLGMRKKKKLSRFFTDRKLSKIEREKIWVIESEKKILWVVGQRIDDRFKIEKNTQSVLKITIGATADASIGR